MKLADFGLAVRAHGDNHHHVFGVGTVAYMAPELFDHEAAAAAAVTDTNQPSSKFNPSFGKSASPSLSSPTAKLHVDLLAADMYAVGVLLWQLWARVQPWVGSTTSAIVEATHKGRRLPLTNTSNTNDATSAGPQKPHPRHPMAELCPALASLVSNCWHEDPLERPSARSAFDRFESDVLPQLHALRPLHLEPFNQAYETALTGMMVPPLESSCSQDLKAAQEANEIATADEAGNVFAVNPPPRGEHARLLRLKGASGTVAGDLEQGLSHSSTTAPLSTSSSSNPDSVIATETTGNLSTAPLSASAKQEKRPPLSRPPLSSAHRQQLFTDSARNVKVSSNGNSSGGSSARPSPSESRGNSPMRSPARTSSSSRLNNGGSGSGNNTPGRNGKGGNSRSSSPAPSPNRPSQPRTVVRPPSGKPPKPSRRLRAPSLSADDVGASAARNDIIKDSSNLSMDAEKGTSSDKPVTESIGSSSSTSSSSSRRSSFNGGITSPPSSRPPPARRASRPRLRPLAGRSQSLSDVRGASFDGELHAV